VLSAAVSVVYRRPIGAVVTVQRVRRRLQMYRLDSNRSMCQTKLSAFEYTQISHIVVYTAASIATAGPEISQSDATQTANETESILRNLSINIKIQIPCGRLSSLKSALERTLK